MKKRLNLGCGTDSKEGWINLDKFNKGGVDVVHNLNIFPYPFESESFDYILAKDVIEHLSIDFDDIMIELDRILIKGGILKLVVPYHAGFGSVTPEHKMYFCLHNFKFANSWTSFQKIWWDSFKVESIRLEVQRKAKKWFWWIEKIVNYNNKFLFFCDYLRIPIMGSIVVVLKKKVVDKE